MPEELKGRVTWDTQSAIKALTQLDNKINALIEKCNKLENINLGNTFKTGSLSNKIKKEVDSSEYQLQRLFNMLSKNQQTGLLFASIAMSNPLRKGFGTDSLSAQRGGDTVHGLSPDMGLNKLALKQDQQLIRSVENDYASLFKSIEKGSENAAKAVARVPKALSVDKSSLEYALFGNNSKRAVDIGQANTNLQKISGQWNQLQAKLIETPKIVEGSAATSLNSIMRFAEGVYIAILGSRVISHLIETTNRLQAVAITFKAVAKDQKTAGEEMEWIKTKAMELGQNYLEASQSYAKFYAASKNIMDRQQIRDIYESLMITSTVLHKQPYEFRLMALALEQMSSKGKVSTEELRRQLGEHLPGAIDIAARSMGVTQASLMKMLQDGTLQAGVFLPKFAKTLKEEYINGLDAAKKSTQTMLGHMQNAWIQLEETLAKSGFISALGNIAKTITGILKNPIIVGFTATLGVLLNLISLFLPLILAYLTAFGVNALIVAINGEKALLAWAWIVNIATPLHNAVAATYAWMVAQNQLNSSFLFTYAIRIADWFKALYAAMLAEAVLVKSLIVEYGILGAARLISQDIVLKFKALLVFLAAELAFVKSLIVEYGLLGAAKLLTSNISMLAAGAITFIWGEIAAVGALIAEYGLLAAIEVVVAGLNPFAWAVIIGLVVVGIVKGIIWLIQLMINGIKQLYNDSLAFRFLIESILAPFKALEACLKRIQGIWKWIVDHSPKLGNPFKAWNDKNDRDAVINKDTHEYYQGRPSIRAFLENNPNYQKQTGIDLYARAVQNMRAERGMSSGKMSDKIEINNYIEGSRQPEDVAKEVTRHNKNFLEGLFERAFFNA